jgi:hypothetical protein
LSDGADKIVGELKKLLQQVKTSYEKAADFVKEIGVLAEKGTRFTKLVADFLGKAFEQADRTEIKVIRMRVQTTHQSETIVSASRNSKGMIVLAGRSGNGWNADPVVGRISPRYRLGDRPVLSIAHVENDAVALGTSDGLEVIETGRAVDSYEGRFRERVVALAVPMWGAKGTRRTIITGSREGYVRRWTLAGGLTLFNEEAYEKVGHKVLAMCASGDEVIVATGAELVFLDPNMRTKRAVKVPFEVNGIDVIDNHTLVVCGQGRITHVNLESGIFSRIITASDTAEYSCVSTRDAASFYFGTTKGRVGIMELASGEEIGTVELGFEVRGIVPTEGKILAYGGTWGDKVRSAAFVTLEDLTNVAAA